jgi:primase-polymerase (primpol)-like protein
MKNELIETLKSYRQWVTHDEKKRPFQPDNGHFADVTNPDTWTDYETVRDYGRKGFVLTESDPFTVVDLDHCIGSHGRVRSETSKILLYFQSYTEISPSGTGFHIWVKGKIPSAIKRTEFEIYSRARYITVTGNPSFNCPLASCQLQLDRVYEKYGQPSFAEKETLDKVVECKEDLRSLYRVSEQFRKIWNLECDFKKSDGSPDWSSFDMALIGLIKEWSNEKIVWAVQYFREQHDAKPKHTGAILTTIGKARS